MHPYLVEGIGEDFYPETFDPTIVDQWVTVSDRTRSSQPGGWPARRGC